MGLKKSFSIFDFPEYEFYQPQVSEGVLPRLIIVDIYELLLDTYGKKAISKFDLSVGKVAFRSNQETTHGVPVNFHHRKRRIRMKWLKKYGYRLDIHMKINSEDEIEIIIEKVR